MGIIIPDTLSEFIAVVVENIIIMKIQAVAATMSQTIKIPLHIYYTLKSWYLKELKM